MGLLNKLKNALFEEIEDFEEDKEETVKVSEKTVYEKEKDVSKKKEPVKMTFEADDEIVSDRELFKAEPTFNFPVFDEKEFEEVKKEDKIEVPAYEKRREEAKPRVKSSSVNVDRDRKKISETRYDYKEIRKIRDTERKESQKFTPSPVISPVYGVLDKNYKKEDIVVSDEEKKVIDVDSVRKKAFGTLEDDIEKTLSTPKKDFYKKEESFKKREDRNLSDLLMSSAEDVIPVSMEPKDDYSSFNIEEESIESILERTKELEILDRPISKSVEENLVDNTLENDLFDLIDSMYETREDGE